MMKGQVRLSPDWNSKAAFHLLDSQQHNYITHYNLFGFLKSNGWEASESELIAIIRRMDENGNGKIEFKEFSNVFQPI